MKIEMVKNMIVKNDVKCSFCVGCHVNVHLDLSILFIKLNINLFFNNLKFSIGSISMNNFFFHLIYSLLNWVTKTFWLPNQKRKLRSLARKFFGHCLKKFSCWSTMVWSPHWSSDRNLCYCQKIFGFYPKKLAHFQLLN